MIKVHPLSLQYCSDANHFALFFRYVPASIKNLLLLFFALGLGGTVWLDGLISTNHVCSVPSFPLI
jgi:hypothetical protein